MQKKHILPFLFVGLVFSIGIVMLVSQRHETSKPPLAAHQWGNLAKLDELRALLKGFNVKSLIDTSCEEAGLIQQLDIKVEQYIGIDRRKEIIEGIRSSLDSAHRTFLVQDITRDLLPQADMILCWDTLQAFSPSQIRSTLRLLKKSGVKYLLASHFPELQINQKGARNHYRPINWTLPPYRFPDPMIQISEQKENGEVKSLALWKISELPY